MTRKVILAAIALAAVVACAAPASATPFVLNQSACCGVGPFGTVNVTQYATDVVDVWVTLNTGVGFVVTGNGENHPDFAFNLLGAPDLTGHLSVIQTGTLQGGGAAAFSFSQWLPPGTGTMSDGFGTYEYAFNCSNCGNGASNPALGPLEFRVSLAGITPAWFVANAAGTIFAADIVSPSGATGLVRATGSTPPAVPEPASMVLLGTGLVGLAYKVRRRK